MATLTLAESGLPEALYNALLEIVLRYKSEDSEVSERVVKFKDDIIDNCTQHKFCQPRTLHVKELAPHPTNRDGEGLSANRSETRMKVIKKGGCSLKTLRPNCVAMEDDPATRHIAKFGMDEFYL